MHLQNFDYIIIIIMFIICVVVVFALNTNDDQVTERNAL